MIEAIKFNIGIHTFDNGSRTFAVMIGNVIYTQHQIYSFLLYL